MSVIETMIDIPAEHERNVCGQFDTYLKKIERTLHVTMIARDGEIKIIGPEKTIGQAKSVFNNLIELSKRGNTITEQNVDYALSLSFTENDELPEEYKFTPFIGFVFVDEPYRGKRLSELMIQSAILYARELGYEKIYIMSGEIGLYEKYGFEKLGDYETIYGSIDQLFVKSTIL